MIVIRLPHQGLLRRRTCRWKHGLAIVMAVAVTAGAHAATPPSWLLGTWRGEIVLPNGTNLPLVLEIAPTGTVFRSPAQGNAPIAAVLAETHGKPFLEMPTIGASFTPAESGGQRLDGPFLQRGRTLQAHFHHVDDRVAAALLPPGDTPRPPFPYISRDLSIAGADGVKLAATLDLPPGKGPFPAVVLIGGSGPTTRDEDLAGHKPFLFLADRLARAGIASLRYDKRGVGQSGGGDYEKATEPVLVSDATAAARVLRTQAPVQGGKVGLIGHSEGSILAPQVAAADPDVAFVVLLSAPALSGEQTIISQVRAIVTMSGAGRPAIERAVAQQKVILDAVMSAPDQATAQHTARTVLLQQGKSTSEADRGAEMLSSDWYRSFLAADPKPALEALHVPVLAIMGGRDTQVVPDLNLPRLQAALRGVRDREVVLLPELNHLLQPAWSGLPSEYGSSPVTMDPAVPTLISNWIHRHEDNKQ